jgi:hypothetical protein
VASPRLVGREVLGGNIRDGVSALCWEAMEGQEKRKPSLAELYHAVVRAVGTLLPL